MREAVVSLAVTREGQPSGDLAQLGQATETAPALAGVQGVIKERSLDSLLTSQHPAEVRQGCSLGVAVHVGRWCSCLKPIRDVWGAQHHPVAPRTSIYQCCAGGRGGAAAAGELMARRTAHRRSSWSSHGGVRCLLHQPACAQHISKVRAGGHAR